MLSRQKSQAGSTKETSGHAPHTGEQRFWSKSSSRQAHENIRPGGRSVTGNCSPSGKPLDPQPSPCLHLADSSLHKFFNESFNPEDAHAAACEVVAAGSEALPDASLVELDASLLL